MLLKGKRTWTLTKTKRRGLPQRPQRRRKAGRSGMRRSGLLESPRRRERPLKQKLLQQRLKLSSVQRKMLKRGQLPKSGGVMLLQKPGRMWKREEHRRWRQSEPQRQHWQSSRRRWRRRSSPRGRRRLRCGEEEPLQGAEVSHATERKRQRKRGLPQRQQHMRRRSALPPRRSSREKRRRRRSALPRGLQRLQHRRRRCALPPRRRRSRSSKRQRQRCFWMSKQLTKSRKRHGQKWLPRHKPTWTQSWRG